MTTDMPACAGRITEAEAGGILTIDLAALAANWRFLRDRAGSAECAAVVKANAYGIGIEQAAPALAAAGCKTFFVAHLSEALRVREAAPEAVIYVLNGLLPNTGNAYVRNDLRPVLCSHGQLAEWADISTEQGRKLPAAVQVDTGMTRLGLPAAEAENLARHLRQRFDMCLLMSHFIASEETASPRNHEQIDRFAAIRRFFNDVPASLANSSGILLPQTPHYDLVRPGYALYGGNPCPGMANPMQPVVRLEGRVIQFTTVSRGTDVGYNSRWTAKRESRLATISVGYADGFPRAASGTAEKYDSGSPMGYALIGSVLCPFVGTVSMDLIIIDVTDADTAQMNPGDLVTLIGDDLTVDRVGANAGTIGYEILTSLGQRYARRYIGAAA